MAERILGEEGTRRRRRFRFLLLPLVIAALLALLLAGSARAVHDLQFQLDGEVSTQAYTVPSAGTQVFDWGPNTAAGSASGSDTAHSLFTVTTGASTQTVANNPTTVGLGKPFASASFVRDFTSGAGCTLDSTSTTVCTNDISTYATGSKDTLGIGNGGWQCNRDNNVNSKIDIMNAYTASYFTGAGSTGDHIIYFGLEKNKNNGTNDVGIWLLQGTASCSSPGGAVNFTGQHQNKDVLVVSEFTQGGGVSTIKAFQWAAAPTGQFAGDGGCIDSNGNPNPATGGCNNLPIGGGGDCKTTSSSGTHPVDAICATTNASCTTAGLPCNLPWNQTLFTPWLTWDATLGVGNRVVSPDFFEGAIDVTKVFGAAGGGAAPSCFNTVVPDTRSSASPTATLFDFVANQIGECKSDLTTTPVDSADHTAAPASTIPLAPADAKVTVQDKTVLAVSGVSSFAGSIAWFLCGPTLSTSTQLCDGTTGNVGAAVGTQSITTGGTYFSPVTTVTKAGRYCFRAEFTSTTTGVPGSTDSRATECFTVAPVTPTLTTQATTAVEKGGTIDDTATLSGTAKHFGSGGLGDGSINPTTLGGPAGGTITFKLYGPAGTTASCTDLVATRVVNVSGNGSAYKASDGTGGAITVNATGTYYWTADYSGDSPNTNSASSGCGATNESSKVVDARISIAPNGTNEVGQNHTFTATLKKDVGDGLGFVNAAGETVTITLANSNGATTSPLTFTGTTNASGQFQATFTSATAGVVTGNASASLTVAGVSLQRDTDPATTTIGSGGGSGPAVKTFVDASISITPTQTNEVGHPHTFTITVTAIPKGATPVTIGVPTVSFSPAPGTVGPVTFVSLVGTVATYTVTINSQTAGVFTANARDTVTMGSVTVTRDTNPATTDPAGPGGSGPATKTYVDANIALSPLTATNEVNQHHVVTATVKKDPGTGLVLAAGVPVVFTFSGATGNLQFTDPNTDGDNNPLTATTNASGQATVEFTKSTAGTVTINASASVGVGGLTLIRDTDPATAATAGPGGTGPATKTFVNLFITIAPHEETNNVGVQHVWVVTVMQDDGLPAGAQGGDNANGFGPVPDGTHPVVTHQDTAGITFQLILNGCLVNGTVAGTCNYVFSSSTPGTITGHAVIDLLVGGVPLHRETDGSGLNSTDAIKHFVSGSVSWTKLDNGGRPLGGATFSLCRTHDYDIANDMVFQTPLPQPECVNPPVGVLDDGPFDANKTPGQFRVENLPLGRYVAQETIAPQGYELDPNPQTVDLTPHTVNLAAVFGAPFVDSRPVVKITGFGYTNAPDPVNGSGQPDGIFKGTTVYTANLHNYGTAIAHLSGSSLKVTSGNTNLTCDGTADSGLTLPLTGDIAVGGDKTATLTCHYDHPDPTAITALLTVNYTTNGFEYHSSGSPATITFDVDPNTP